jgi:hypothetical protein
VRVSSYFYSQAKSSQVPLDGSQSHSRQRLWRREKSFPCWESNRFLCHSAHELLYWTCNPDCPVTNPAEIINGQDVGTWADLIKKKGALNRTVNKIKTFTYTNIIYGVKTNSRIYTSNSISITCKLGRWKRKLHQVPVLSQVSSSFMLKLPYLPRAKEGIYYNMVTKNTNQQKSNFFNFTPIK